MELVEIKDEVLIFCVHQNKGISNFINTNVLFMVFKECNAREIPYPTYCRQLGHLIPFKG